MGKALNSKKEDECMYKQQVVIENRTGLHARPASDFIAKANQYSSKLYVRNLDEEDSCQANAKSIVMLIAQGLGQGTNVEISAEGEDEKEAVEALVQLIQSKFGED